ncbi:MAG: hypothetical protein J7L32_06860 [Thermoplasmata archaeon]|nr:hypothetical protein [Thermoplasmata archaeon]RLF28372.1 MAG: hypothetical protein DRN01_00080 [Thermoplasmata archaeon]
MGKRIFREIVAPFSVFLIVVGLVLSLMGAVWIWYRGLELGVFTDTVNGLGDWNYYLFVAGLVLLIAGIWYLYDFFRNKKFLVEELKTDKRSELIKKKAELEDVVKKLPSKYEKMFEEKKRKLKIK